MGFAMVPPKLKFSLGAIAAALNVYVRLCNFKTFRMRCATFRRQGAERRYNSDLDLAARVRPSNSKASASARVRPLDGSMP